jgi:hypothetical protein
MTTPKKKNDWKDPGVFLAALLGSRNCQLVFGGEFVFNPEAGYDRETGIAGRLMGFE